MDPPTNHTGQGEATTDIPNSRSIVQRTQRQNELRQKTTETRTNLNKKRPASPSNSSSSSFSNSTNSSSSTTNNQINGDNIIPRSTSSTKDRTTTNAKRLKLNASSNASQPPSITSEQSKQAMNHTDEIERTMNPQLPTAGEAQACAAANGYCPFVNHIGALPRYFTKTKLKGSGRCKVNCGIDHKRVAIIYLANRLYGNTRYGNEQQILDRYFTRFGEDGQLYHAMVLRVLSETDVGKELLLHTSMKIVLET